MLLVHSLKASDFVTVEQVFNKKMNQRCKSIALILSVLTVYREYRSLSVSK